MRRRLCFLTLAALLIVPRTGWSQPRPAAAAATDVTAGRRVFDAQCAWCHGAGGEGGTGPNLHGRLRHATTSGSIVEIVMNGIPGTDMPSFRLGLTDRSARQAAAYVASLSRIPARPGPGNAERGSALYQSSGCASCHVVEGHGGVIGPVLTEIGAQRGPAYLRESLIKPAASHPPGYLVVRAVPASGAEVRGIRVNEDVFWVEIRDQAGAVHTLRKSELSRLDREIDASLMPSYESRLTTPQLDDLIAYLGTLRGVK
jgi:putative heme-binding domain-containing protein